MVLKIENLDLKVLLCCKANNVVGTTITNVVAVFIICITFIPILYASYITRNTTEVEGSSK